MRRVLTFLAAGLLSGCASMSESECRRDWGELGRRDGERGEPLSVLDEHREACARHGIKADTKRYRAERAAALAHYCTAAGGYVAGRRGDVYQDVCQPEREPAFKPAYKTGRRVHTLVLDLQDLQQRMDDVEYSALASGDLSPEARRERQYQTSELRRLYREAQHELERLDGRYALEYKVDPLPKQDFDPQR